MMEYMRSAMLRYLGMAIAALTLWGSSAAAQDAQAPDRPEVIRRQVAGLLKELDSNQFETRTRAAARIEQLVARPELGELLATEFQQALLRPEVSFEVRSNLRRWQGRLPKVALRPPETITPAELDRLIGQLDADAYGTRLGATQRLLWLVENPKLVQPVMNRLKQRLADTNLPYDAWQRIEAARQLVRGAWLQSDQDAGQLPPVSDRQIGQWIDALARPAPADEESKQRLARQIAEQELLDVLARDDHVPRVVRALRARLAGPVDPQAAAKLAELLDLTRPALVAEYWTGRQQAGEQHLLVGVASQAPVAVRPSHFDRIDDQVAHCISGQSLEPGDYPVHVAFPHPQTASAFFHLINLPTPRRRMAYAYYVKTDEAARLAAISRRTLDRVLAEKRLLGERELAMLAQLSPAEVSRFAGRYFLLVDDAPLDAAGRERIGSRPSHHGMICGQLAAEGTKDAVPGLLQAMGKGRFLPPTSQSPYRLEYLAALSIAIRDPWPEVDAWLAGQVRQTEPLLEYRSGDRPELGATAAALLLKRHQQTLQSFDLQPAGDPLLMQLGIDGYRFGSAQGRGKVQEWWEQEAEKIKRL